MIVKTISDETTLSGQRIVTSLTARKIAQEEATRQLEVDIQCLKNYEIECQKGTVSAKTFATTMNGASVEAQRYASNIKNGTGSVQTFVANQKAIQSSMNETSIASKAAAVGINIFKAALNTLIFFAVIEGIQLLVKGIDSLILTAEEAEEKAETLRNNMQSFFDEVQTGQKTISSISDRFSELSKHVAVTGENIDLTKDEYSEYLDICNQVKSIMPELVVGYTNEGNAIINLKDNVDSLTEAYKEIIRVKAAAFVSNGDEEGNTIQSFFDDYKNFTEGEGGLFAPSAGGLWNNKSTDYEDYYGYDEVHEWLSEVADLSLKDLQNLQKGTTQATYLYALLKENGYELANITEDNYEAVHDVLDTRLTSLEGEMATRVSNVKMSLQQMLYADRDYWDIDNKEALSAIDSLFGSVDAEFIKQNNLLGQTALQSFESNVIKLFEDKNTQQAMIDIYTPQGQDEPLQDYSKRVNDAIQEIQDYAADNKIDITFDFGKVTEEVNELEAQYQHAVDYAKDKFAGYDPTAFFEKNSINTQEEIDKWLEIAQAANSATEAEKKYVEVLIHNTVADSLSEIIDNASGIVDNVQTIQDAINKLAGDESLSYDEVTKLLELDPSLADSFTRTAQGYKVAIDTLLEARSKYIDANKGTVESQLEAAKSDVKKYEDEIQELEKQKAQYEADLQNIKDGEYTKQQEDEIAKKIKEIETNIELANGKIEESGQLASVLKVILNEISNPIEKQVLSLSDVISKLSDAKDLLDTVKDEISNNGAISLETLEKISSSYPELENSVADYMTGLISASDLLKDVQKQYDNDTIAYRENIAEKIRLTDTELNNYLLYLNTKVKDSEDYYRNIGGLEKKFIDYMADNYSLDLESCRTWAQAKTAMIEQTKLAVYDADKLYDFETMSYKDGWTDFVNSHTLQAVEAVQSIFDNYESAVEEFGKRSAVFNKADEFVANSSSKKNSTKSTTNEVFDWIEVRLNRLADKTKSFFDKVSDYVSNITNERNLGKAINSTQKEIDANKKAEQKYRQKANSINLSESWKKKVREGNFSIDELTDETLIKNIQDYQKWWEKARDSAQNIADLTEQKKDYLSQQFDSKYERQQRITDKYSTANDKINDIISYKENKGGKVSVGDYDNLNRNLTSQNKSLSTQNKMLLQQQKTVQKGSAKWQEYQEKIDANSQAIRQNTIAIAENNNKKFDLKISDYERSVGNHERTVTNIQNSMDLAKAQGKKTGDSYYRDMINASKMQNTVLQKERNAIFNERKTVQYGSERYDELTEKLRNVDDQISENNKSQAEWNATIRNIPMDRLNEYLDITEAIASRTKAYIERLSYINGESKVSANQIRIQKYSNTDIEKQQELFNRYLTEFKNAKKEGRLADADEYQKLYLQADSTYNEMLKTNEELERQARDIELYRNYEKDLQHIEDVKKALSSLSDMINDDALYNDDGSFSEHGIAKIALTMKNLEEAKSSVDDYKKEIDALNKAHKQGKYNDDEYAEKLRELTDGYQNATSEVNNYTEAIKDLYKNQAQEELNALNELIDARSEALQKKKE